MKTIRIILLILIIIGLGLLFTQRLWVDKVVDYIILHSDEEKTEAPAETAATKEEIKQNVENYLRENIGELSPVESVLGGKWYVVSVSIDTEKKSGSVIYEDGHVQETKNFSYAVNEKGEVLGITILSSQKLETKSGVKGIVTLGPTCPVERIPQEPGCEPRPFAVAINILKPNSTAILKTTQSGSDGKFSAELPAGEYILQAAGGKIFPRCGDVTVVVKSGAYTQTEISCDTGIR